MASHAKFLQAVCAVYWHTQSATPRLWTHRCNQVCKHLSLQKIELVLQSALLGCFPWTGNIANMFVHPTLQVALLLTTIKAQHFFMANLYRHAESYCLQAAAGVYNFLGASIVPKNDLQLAREWVHQTVSTARKCSPPR